jgi:hypothetical protein
LECPPISATARSGCHFIQIQHTTIGPLRSAADPIRQNFLLRIGQGLHYTFHWWRHFVVLNPLQQKTFLRLISQNSSPAFSASLKPNCRLQGQVPGWFLPPMTLNTSSDEERSDVGFKVHGQSDRWMETADECEQQSVLIKTHAGDSKDVTPGRPRGDFEWDIVLAHPVNSPAVEKTLMDR